MPPGGEGFYYFSVYLVVVNPEFGYFDLQINGETFCTSFAEQTDTPNNDGPTSCTAVSYAEPGIISVNILNFLSIVNNSAAL